jgi:beta-N-acetylhexosaminidase
MTTYTKAAIVGIESKQLTDAEKDLFQKHKPFGFILFTRNCQNIHQTKALVKELRACVGWECPILIDQEGGRVARLKSPEWEEFPTPKTFRDYYDLDAYLGQKKVFENAVSMARQLNDIEVNVNCAPMVDLYFDDAHDIVGDRALGTTPFQAAFMARRVIDGFHENGIIPIIKHIPGHGRAMADSHLELPRVSAPMRDLVNEDFHAFKLLVANLKNTGSPMPWAMTAHLLYEEIDPENCATHSSAVVRDIIRDHIGFDGLLITDCLTMAALSGDYAERATKSLDAGCDIVLHCSGHLGQMSEILQGIPTMAKISLDRYIKSLPQNDGVIPELKSGTLQ